MRKLFLFLMYFVAVIDLNAQSVEILEVLKNKLSTAQQIDKNLTNLKAFVESRETNENSYASKLMNDASNLESQAIKGLNNAKKLNVKLNDPGKSYWVNEIDDLIGYFTTIKKSLRTRYKYRVSVA